MRRPRTLHIGCRLAHGYPRDDRTRSRSRLPGVHMPGRRRLRSHPARPQRGHHTRRFRRHAARAGQRAEARPAIPRAGPGRRRRHQADCLAQRSGQDCPGQSIAQRRLLRGRLRNDHGAGCRNAGGRSARQSTGTAVGPPDLAGRSPAARFGDPGFRCPDRSRTRVDGHGTRRVGIRGQQTQHPCRYCRLSTGYVARRDVLGTQAAARRSPFPRQLLPRGRAPGRQCGGAPAAGYGHGGLRR